MGMRDRVDESIVNGQIEVERGRLVWKLLAHPSLEHAASV